MTLEQILPSLYRVPLKAVNAFVIDLGDDGLVLIDAGTPDDTKAILDVVGELGRRSADVRHILVTHCHADHAGGLAELKKATGAPAYMHPVDAEMVRVGRALRPLTPTPGPLNRAVFWLFLRNGPKTLPATGVEHEVSDGEVLPFTGGIRAVHAPATVPASSRSSGLDTVGCSSRPTPRPTWRASWASPPATRTWKRGGAARRSSPNWTSKRPASATAGRSSAGRQRASERFSE